MTTGFFERVHQFLVPGVDDVVFADRLVFVDEARSGSFVPGDMVRRATGHTTSLIGIVVSVEVDEEKNDVWIGVLWEAAPKNPFADFKFPMINKASNFSKLTSNNIVNIQPMTLPSAGVFYIDYKYGSGSILNNKDNK